MNIDVHAHFYPQPFLDLVNAEQIDFGLPGFPLTIFPKMYDIDERLADMEIARIDTQVLSLGPPGIDAGDAAQSVALAQAFNDAVAELVSDRPDRFAAFAALPLQDPAVAASELERGVRELGLRGGHLFTNVRGRFLDASEFWPIYEVAEGLDVPLFVHPTTPACLKGSEDWGLMVSVGLLADTTLSASRLVFSGVLERFPKLNFILAHLGATLPYILPRIDIETELDAAFIDDFSVPFDGRPSEHFLRFYVDTVSHHAPAYRCAIDTWGSARILLGSDYPYSRWERTVDAIEELTLPQEQEEQICGANAQQLLKLNGTSVAHDRTGRHP